MMDTKEHRYIVCPRVKSSPLIDGQLNDSVWKKAGKISRFLPMDARKVKEQTEVYLIHNKSYLFLAFICHESQMEKLKAKSRKGSSKIFTDDNVELFFDARHNHTSCFRMAINPWGASWAMEGEGKPWVPGAVIKVSLAADSWVIELSLPLKSLGFNSSAPAAIGVNFTRTRWAREKIECSSWALRAGDFCQPIKFGDLIWGREIARVEKVSCRNRLYQRHLKVKVSILAPKKTILNWELKLISPRGKTLLRKRKIEEIKKKVVELTALVREEGRHWLSINLRDQRTKLLLCREAYPVDIPKLITFSLKENSVSYYQKAKSIPLSFGLNLPLSLLKKMLIRIFLRNEKSGATSFWLLRSIKQRAFSRTLRTKKLLPGDYILTAELCRQEGKVLSSSTQLFSKPDSKKDFLLINGCEANAGDKIHLLALDIKKVPEGRTDQEKIDWVNTHSGLPIIAHIGMVKTDDILQLNGFCGVEILNRAFATFGETKKWDILLSQGQKVWALAVDDTHALKRHAGRGWIMVKTSLFSLKGILTAIKKGSFYATNGPLIKDISLKGNSLSIETVKKEKITFIAQGGEKLKQVVAKKATYSLRGTERYLRIEVGKNIESKAWTQPLIIQGKRIYNPYQEGGSWYKGNLHSHTTNSDGDEHPTRIWSWYRKKGYNFLAITDHNVITG